MLEVSKHCFYMLHKDAYNVHYPPTKWEGASIDTFCPSGNISQYLSVGFDSFLVQMISTMDSRYPISLVKIDPLTLELLPLFSIGNYKTKPILAFLCDDPHISS